MGALTSNELVLELQRRVTNLSDDDALNAINRACRWILRQASFEFMSHASVTLVVDTPLAAATTYSGTIQMKNGEGLGYSISGDAFDTTGTWSVVTGDIPGPLTATGHDGLEITIDGDPYTVYWAGQYTGGWGSPQTDGLLIFGSWGGLDGTYDWSLTVGSTTNVSGPADLDPGKAKQVLNPDGSPVQHAPWSEFWASQNYNTLSNTNYDTYTIVTDNTQSPSTNKFYFFPSRAGSVTLYYHKQMTDMNGGGDRSPLPKDFDDLIVDFAEAEERRVYDIGDQWQILFARSQDQLKVLIDGYKSMTSQPAMVGESAASQQEDSQIGRA